MTESLLSLRSNRDGEYRLSIGGHDWGDHAKDITFEFAEQTGGSRLTFTTREPTQHLVGRPVLLEMGYEREMVEYWSGRLTKPMPDPPTFTSAAVALGPFSQMMEASFGEQTTYRGKTVRSAIWDIMSKVGYPAGTAIIEGGARTSVEEKIFAEDVTLMEGATAIVDPADFVMTDIPGGGRLVMPRPKAGQRTRSVATYQPGDYETFKVDDLHPIAYSKVVVFRRGENEGNYEVRATADVPRVFRQRTPPKNRIYFIPEFLGTRAEARQTAYDTSLRIASGEFKWEMTAVPFNPFLRRYDQIRGTREIERVDGWYRETYDLTIDEHIRGTVASFTMDLAGLGVIRESEKIAPQRVHIPEGLSPGNIKPSPSAPVEEAEYGIDGSFYFNAPLSYMGTDAGGFYVDPALSAGKTGIDTGGDWWIDG